MPDLNGDGETGYNTLMYCQCGCGHKTTIAKCSNKGRGDVRGQPRKFLKGHATRSSGPEYIEEDHGFGTPCWVWQLYIGRDGYGRRTVNGIKRLAHRIMYECYVGKIPDGLSIDHLCRNRACVNPEHLEPVTHSENVQRGYAARRP